VSESWRTDRPSVLVVSDDPDAGELLGRLLERDGWPVDLAISGAAGLTALCDATDPYTVVVIELGPVPAGELLASIRDTPPVARTRVVVCAGSDAGRVDAWIGGTDGYLVHPFEGAHFLAEITAVVARPDTERHDHRQQQIAVAGD